MQHGHVGRTFIEIVSPRERSVRTPIHAARGDTLDSVTPYGLKKTRFYEPFTA